MTKRKAIAAVKTPEPPKEARGGRIVMIDDNKHFTALDLARYNLAQMKMQSALQSVGLKEYEIKNTNLEWGRLVQEFEKKMGHLTKEREQLSSFVKAEEKDLLELQSELGDAYDIVFDQSLAYDDKTGKIVVLEQKTDPAVPKE